MVGVFAATDVFLFYVFFEAMLIPVYFLIGSYGGARRQYAAVKFLLFSLAGGLVMLVGVLALYHYGPGGSDGFLVTKLTGLDLGTTPERLMFVAFFFAFAVKAPMWPVHTWLPDAATEARPATAVLLVGVLDKVGTYGMIRFCLQLFPEAVPVGHARRAHPRGHLDHVRRAAGHRPDRRHAPDRLHLDQPLRLHRAGHLRPHDHRRCRLDAVHAQPRLLDRGAVPHRGDARRAPGQQAHPGLRWLAAGDARPRRCLPRRGPVGSGAAGSELVRLGVPGPRRDVPAVPRSPRSSRRQGSSWPRSTSC